MSLNGQWIEVFKAGKQTDSAGHTRDWTEEDLDKMVSIYNDQTPDERRIAPIVKGHPESDKPAQGWVAALKRVGGKLLAKLDGVSDEFNNMVKEGRYRMRSISLYNNLMLKHIGFLGAVQPAVPGLADPIFDNTKGNENE